MHYQMVLLGKTLTALVTNVWPLPGMEFAVCHQVAFQWERPATFLANEWPLAAISNGTREEEKKRSEMAKYTASESVWMNATIV